VRALKAKGASLKATEQPIDTSTAAGKTFLDMLGVFAEFETSIRKERQLEGIAKAKAAGVYMGRKPSLPVEKIREMKAAGIGPAAIARELLFLLFPVQPVGPTVRRDETTGAPDGRRYGDHSAYGY
jgi:DNA invertase Pin-like site-specific DNA recombinase